MQTRSADLGQGYEASLVDVAVAGAKAVAGVEAVGLAAVAQLLRYRTAVARDELMAWRRDHPDTAVARRSWDVHWSEVEDLVRRSVVTEVAVALRMSEQTAGERVAFALDLTAMTPETWAALRDGTLDVVRARRIVDAIRPVHARDPALARQLEQQMLARAGTLTPSQLARVARRLVLAACPGLAQDARERAQRDRHCWVEHGRDPGGCDAGQATLGIAGRADRVQAAFDRLTRTAENILAGNPDDSRTLDQIRADLALSALLGDRWPVAGRAVPDPPVQVHLVLPLSALTGGTEPAELLGHGPVSPGLALDLLAHPVSGRLREDVTFTKWLVDARGVVTATSPVTYRPTAAVDRTVRARDLTCRFPGCSARAHRAHRRPDLDHVVPWPRGGTDVDNLAVLCRAHHNAKTRGEWTVVADADTGALTWTSRTTGRSSTTHSTRWPTGP